MSDRRRIGPILSAGLLMGAGLGGFIDGIVFHQILQWHNMLSGWLPPDNLVDAKINMLWDGIFHAAVWVLTVAGLAVLFRAGHRPDVLWSGRAFLGALLAGWGCFNVIEGLINHQFLGLHHVMEYASNTWPADLGFLMFGALLILAGWQMIARR